MSQSETPQTIFVISICILLIGISHQQVEKIGEYHQTTLQKFEVQDLAHKVVPNLDNQTRIVDVIPLLLLVSLFFLSDGLSIFKEFMFMYLLIMVIRALTIISTILPKQDKCVPETSYSTFIFGGCYDKVFSGHTAFVAGLTLILLRKKQLSLPVFWGINLINMFLILSTRIHQSIDVILGFVLTQLVQDGDQHVFENFFKSVGK